MIILSDQILPLLPKLKTEDFKTLLIINRYLSTEPYCVEIHKLVELFNEQESVLYFQLIRLQNLGLWDLYDKNHKHIKVLDKNILKKNTEYGIFIQDKFSDRILRLVARENQENLLISLVDNPLQNENNKNLEPDTLDRGYILYTIYTPLKNGNKNCSFGVSEEGNFMGPQGLQYRNQEVFIDKLRLLIRKSINQSSIKLAEYFLSKRYEYDLRLMATSDDKTWAINWARHLFTKYPRIPILTFQKSIDYFFNSAFWAPNFNSLQFLDKHIQEFLAKDTKGKKTNIKIKMIE